ncbi:MAG: DUF1659 domain-containing protein [Turicibacter sp.]
MKENLLNRHLLIYLSAGLGENEKDITKIKTFKNIRHDSTEENLSNFGELFSVLSSHTHLKTLISEYRLVTKESL